MRFVVTAGYNGSLHAQAILQTLANQGHTPVGCVVVKTFQRKRLFAYLRQYGLNVVLAKIRSLLLNESSSSLSGETEAIKNYLKEHDLVSPGLTKLCRDAGVKTVHVDSLNSSLSLDFLSELKPDVIVYAGGGILRKAFISIPKIGVLNAHSGRLPFFRGMNVIEWAILYGQQPSTSIHFIDKGIDTGRVLHIEPITANSKDLTTIRGKGTRHNVELISRVMQDLNAYVENSFTQQPEDGKQFFVMHEELRNRVQKYLNSQNYPSKDGKSVFD